MPREKRARPSGIDLVQDLNLKELLNQINDKLETVVDVVKGVAATGVENSTAILELTQKVSDLTDQVNGLIYSGFQDFAEIGDPAQPGANTGRLYTRDNGSGKSQLVVRFNTGAVQVIATEP